MGRALRLSDQAFLASAKSSEFVPPSFANIIYWGKPESLSALTDNDPINTWPDSGPNGNDLGGSGHTPTYKTNQLNGNAGVQFDGVNDFLGSGLPTFSATTVYTAFVVLKFNSATGTEAAVAVGALNGYSLIKDTNNREIVNRGIAALTDAACTTNAELWSAVKTAVPLTSFFVNGVATGITNSGANIVAPELIIQLGTFNVGGLFMAGFIFEVLLYDTNLSLSDRQTVEAYLMAKYAL